MTTDHSPGPALTVGGRDPGLADRLNEELIAFNTAATGAADRDTFSVKVTDGAGELIGGLTAWTWGGLCGIELLWVREDSREDGWGGRLLRAAEAEAGRRGCDRVAVSSFTFQAPGFYQRHGYAETGRTLGIPGGNADVHLFKSLNGAMNLRHAVRAIILDEEDRVLLCRFTIPKPTGAVVVWAAPGGGVEPGEAPPAALRRELREEVGLAVDTHPPHVWHQRVVDPGHAVGYDGVVNDYFLVRAASFQPRGEMSDDELAAENIDGFRWWPLEDIAAYRGPELFSPRDLATPLRALLTDGVPPTPVPLGL